MPASVSSTAIGKPISFATFAPNILSSSFTNVKLLAILDASDALKVANVAQLHAMVYPTIPDLLKPANDFTQYQYLKLQMQNGSITVIGIPWISGDISISNYQTINITVGGNVSASDVTDINQLLISNGYTVNSIGISAS